MHRCIHQGDIFDSASKGYIYAHEHDPGVGHMYMETDKQLLTCSLCDNSHCENCIMKLGVDSKDNYSIYEVADVYPMHYSMLTLDRNQPGTIRKEFMTLIEKEWQQGSKNIWIEIVAASTGYTVQLIPNKREPDFVRKNVSPLTGSEVNLLSDETIQKFLCYTSKDTKLVEHYTIGHLRGLQIIQFLLQ